MDPAQQQDDQTILAPPIPRQYLMRQIGLGWFRSMEEVYEHVAVGTRILIRRDRYQHPILNTAVIHDYLITRVAHETLYGNWTHQMVAYPIGHPSPYPETVDAFTARDAILAQHRNNFVHNPHPEGMEGQPQPEQNAFQQAQEFLGPAPSSALFQFR